MSRFFLIFLFVYSLLFFSACEPNNRTKAYLPKVNIALRFDTSLIAILDNDSVRTWVSKDIKGTELTQSDLFLIDSLLKVPVDIYNKQQEERINKLFTTNAERSEQKKYFLINIRQYKRQYVPYVD